MNHPLLLTDDEAVALASRGPHPWTGGIPTVEGTVEALEAAVFRGNRSLYVRGLLNEQGTPSSEINAVVGPLLAAPGRVIVYLGDANCRRDSWGMASAIHVVGDQWVFETVSPVGVHQLHFLEQQDHLEYLRAVLKAAVDAGPDHGSDRTQSSMFLCALAERGETALLACAKKGEVRIGAVRPGGEHPTVEDQVATSVSEACEQLIQAAAGGFVIDDAHSGNLDV